ncbi:MAG: CGNR zinc finger domain-containing protein [Solirubrobacteraceae bacterium]
MADLPETLALPLPGGAPYWYWLGGRPATDFVNTLRERWRRRVETLVTPGDLGLWLTRAGLLDGPAELPAGLLGEARALREAIDACLTAAIEGAPADPAAVAAIDAWLPAAVTPPRLLAGPRLVEVPPRDDPRRALGALALDAARMLGTPAEAERIRICASPTCSARFYDRSPAGRRRWCSMQECGNRDKARRHRARTARDRRVRQASPPPRAQETG